MSTSGSQRPGPPAPAAPTGPGRRSTASSAAAEASDGLAVGRRAALAAFAAALGAGGASACRSRDPAQAATERFLDAYYVEIDLPRARDEASGLARRKVEEQIRLVAGQPAPDAAARPTIHYRFVEAQPAGEGDHRGFVYELAIRIDGGDELSRRVLVTAREVDGRWHAANFQEMEE